MSQARLLTEAVGVYELQCEARDEAYLEELAERLGVRDLLEAVRDVAQMP